MPAPARAATSRSVEPSTSTGFFTDAAASLGLAWLLFLWTWQELLRAPLLYLECWPVATSVVLPLACWIILTASVILIAARFWRAHSTSQLLLRTGSLA